MTQKEKVLARNKTSSRVDINSHLPGVEPKTVTSRGRIELGPEHFEGYHYKCLIKPRGPLREVKRIKVKVPEPKPEPKPELVEAESAPTKPGSKPKTKPKKSRASRRGQDSREVESDAESSTNLSGDTASDHRDGV